MLLAILLASTVTGQLPDPEAAAPPAVEVAPVAVTPDPPAQDTSSQPVARRPVPQSAGAGVSNREAVAVLLDVTRPLKEREAALRDLALGEGSPAVDDLFEELLLEDGVANIRLLSARALEHHKARGPALAQALENDTDERVRRACARALGRLGGDGTRQEAALVGALEDPVVSVAVEAAGALEQVGSRASLAALEAQRSSPHAELRTAARRALGPVRTRAAAHQARQQAAEKKEQPTQANPVLARVLRHAGSVYAVGMGAALGAAAGGLVPLMAWGTRATPAWPLGSVAGAAGGAALGLGYSALRAFDFPLWDALLVSVHGASGFVAGLGYGLWLGDRSSPGFTAALGLLGGGTSLLVSAGMSPFMRARASVPLGAASGSLLGGMATLVMAGAFGKDVLNHPEAALGMAFMGQGAGALLGTALTASVPVTSVDILLVDMGAVAGAALTSGVAVVALSLPFTRISSGVVNGGVLGGMVLGGGAGALAAGFMPGWLERRLSGAFELEEWPVKLVPNLPIPLVQPQGPQKVSGAMVPLLGGTFR
jgi:hypothetical protein